MHGGAQHNPRVLFVCLGNICRSPMAEGAFRAAALRAGLACDVDSAGTAAYHIGHPPDPRAIAAARNNGVEIGSQSARQIRREDFYHFTHIFAMDDANLVGISAQSPRDGSARVALLMDALEGGKGRPVIDPYYGDAALFERVWDEIAAATEALAARFVLEGVGLRL